MKPTPKAMKGGVVGSLYAIAPPTAKAMIN